MADFTIILGNKNYSSWSLRPWLALRRTGVAFDEVVIPLDEPKTRENILRHSPSGKLPCLKHGELVVWDSLAICEYLAEQFPEARLWPADPAARAVARSVSAEMHSGFARLRQAMPMNARGLFPGKGMEPGVQEDINRVTAIWRDCRKRFGDGGPFLFGHFTIADCMYAPVTLRFRTFQPAIDEEATAYCQVIWATPDMQTWLADAKNEPMVIERAEF
ncbi:MAG: glutathione S-transferase family protein [Thalassobaculales bacterium]